MTNRSPPVCYRVTVKEFASLRSSLNHAKTSLNSSSIIFSYNCLGCSAYDEVRLFAGRIFDSVTERSQRVASHVSHQEQNSNHDQKAFANGANEEALRGNWVSNAESAQSQTDTSAGVAICTAAEDDNVTPSTATLSLSQSSLTATLACVNS
ncbi:hypothetical protein TGDOM2_321460 [Toxoplasma gondii GAB2-2007-GAL-DOM2]|uniref:Uncharacterized protein n=1 Tax=Toxoplasma gondii GAB2-2007-GAL-DOM2 TaxID=1130820 RepID=A0A086JCJ2_TOXGO|nr:hypothetical protein TGDOM2_321460 [Toxoplasma gondii GAB2-2007-GAL-DOM2]